MILFAAAADVASKYLVARYAVRFVMAGRYLINLALLAVFLVPRHGWALFCVQQTRMVWLRATGEWCRPVAGWATVHPL